MSTICTHTNGLSCDARFTGRIAAWVLAVLSSGCVRDEWGVDGGLVASSDAGASGREGGADVHDAAPLRDANGDGVADAGALVSNCPSIADKPWIRLIQTQVPEVAYVRQSASNAVLPSSPDDVHAYQFRTMNTTSTDVGSVAVTRTSAANYGKLVVLSSCPGSIEPVHPDCWATSSEVSSVGYVINGSTSAFNPRYHCHLVPGATYYINVFSFMSAADQTVTCSTPRDCSYFITIL